MGISLVTIPGRQHGLRARRWPPSRPAHISGHSILPAATNTIAPSTARRRAGCEGQLRSNNDRGCSAKKNPAAAGFLAWMKRATGLEPVTSSLGSWHSTAELRPRNATRRRQFHPSPPNHALSSDHQSTIASALARCTAKRQSHHPLPKNEIRSAQGAPTWRPQTSRWRPPRPANRQTRR